MGVALNILNFLITIVAQLGPAVMNVISQLDPSHPAAQSLSNAVQALSQAQAHLASAHATITASPKS